MISVCMATYNGERFIRPQIDSILTQLSDNDELIISDDGSTDKTKDIINSYHDARIRLISHKQDEKMKRMKLSPFRLIADNFENALRFSKGDYIFLSDQDDVWTESRVKVFLHYLPNYDIVMCNFKVINDNDVVLNNQYYQCDPISKNVILNIMRSKFLGCSMAFNRKILKYALPFPKNLVGHDLWIGCIGTTLGKYAFIDEPLHLYRRTDENVSTSTSKSKNSFLLRLSYRLSCFIQLEVRLYMIRKKEKHAYPPDR